MQQTAAVSRDRQGTGWHLAAGAVLVAMLAVWWPRAAQAAPNAPVWNGSGPGTATVLSDGSAGNPKFSYSINPAGYTSRTWTFATTAAASGPIGMTYDYQGFHSYYSVVAFLRAFVVHNGVQKDTGLVSAGPANCCSAPSGGFHYTGSVPTLTVTAGDTYGFMMGGRNGDRNNVLQGTLTVTLPPAPTTLQTAGASLSPTLGVSGLSASLTSNGTPRRGSR
jgi:hypothetical protein